MDMTEIFGTLGPACASQPVLEEMFAAGLTGGQDSAQRRLELLKKLSLPEHMSANALLAVLNSCYSREEAVKILGL